MTSFEVPHDVTAGAAEDGLRVVPLARTIDRDAYTPALLGLLNNVLVWGGSRVFLHLRGIGTNEWRILSALANYPGSTAQYLCEVLGMNKSIASKSVNLLTGRGAVAQKVGRRGARHLYLTEQGQEMHDELLAVALERERILHGDLSEAETMQLHSLLLRMLAAQPELLDFERGILDGSSPTPTPGHPDA